MTNDKQRERLVELLSKFNIICRQDCRGLEKSCTQCNREQLADYLLANGVIVPPCKVGDKVYVITTKRPCYACDFCTDYCHNNCRFDDKNKLVVKKAIVCSIEIEEVNKIHIEIEKSKTVRDYNYTCWFNGFGKTVFLTKKEAEQALNNVQNGNSCEGGASDAN